MEGIAAKAVKANNVPLLMTARGENRFFATFALELLRTAAATGSVDQALEAFGTYLSEQADVAHQFGIPFDILIAGWSESRGPFHVHTCEPRAAQALGCEPWILREIPEFWSGGNFDDEEFYEAGFFVDMFDDRLDYYGAKLMDAFRKKPFFRDGSNVPLHGIGGQLVKSVVKADGVDQRVIGTWPDYLGEKIDPAAQLSMRMTESGFSLFGLCERDERDKPGNGTECDR
ncbi:MAG: hypothetical protein JJ911_07800 [Rhizobiaceae bacterium]|nr:hypothetical protein [Rhizobiaceae bacterium]